MTPATAWPTSVPYYEWSIRQRWATSTGDHLITSSVDDSWLAETLCFPADGEGRIARWCPLGSAGPNEHAAAVRAAGYTPTEGPQR